MGFERVWEPPMSRRGVHLENPSRAMPGLRPSPPACAKYMPSPPVSETASIHKGE